MKTRRRLLADAGVFAGASFLTLPGLSRALALPEPEPIEAGFFPVRGGAHGTA